MTGADVNIALDIKIGEYSLGFFDSTRKNSFLKNAVIDKYDIKVEEFQRTQKVTREMIPFLTTLNNLTPTTGTIDISASSTQVPDCYQPVTVVVTAPYKGVSITKTAKLKRADQVIDPFSEGNARYPKYTYTSGVINIEPDNATSVDLIYFANPFYIDVDDNSTVIPYNDKIIQLFIDTAIQYMGGEQRDPFTIQTSLQNQSLNP